MHKPVLITGAGSGIGEATAVHLAHKGFKIFASARRKEEVDAISGLGEGRIAPLTLDVTDENSIAAAFEEIKAAGATLYGVVNNAGISVTGPIEEVPLEDWRRQYETNVFGVANVIRAALPQMRKAGTGRIVNIGSVAGRIASPFMGVYASSKHAVEGLSDALRRELRPHGIKVSVIRPGFINTGFGEQEQEGFKRYRDEGGPYADRVRAFAHWHARGHPAAPGPSCVAEAVYAALTADHPRARYAAPARNWATLAMRTLAPAGVFDRLFERATGLSGYNKERRT
ncbi:MAG: SDR family oxidoreductase [Parvularculaceae bacterium]